MTTKITFVSKSQDVNIKVQGKTLELAICRVFRKLGYDDVDLSQNTLEALNEEAGAWSAIVKVITI